MNEKKERMIRVGVGIFGIVFFFVFFVPCMRLGICNIGNITGMVLGLVFVALAIFFSTTLSFVIWLWDTLAGKICCGLFAFFVAGILVLAAATTFCMLQACKQEQHESSVLLVLGCKVNEKQPSKMLEERLEVTYHYLQTHPESVAILSGGRGKDEGMSEAKCMHRYLVEHGIAQTRLYREENAASTQENFLFSRDMAVELMKNKKETKLAVVTNEFHQYRAGKIAKKLQLETVPISAETRKDLLPTFYIREMYGILYQWLKG